MADKQFKLTKAQKELLQQMKADPSLYISKRWASYEYVLRSHKISDLYQKLRDGWGYFLEPFLTKASDENYNRDVYTLRPDAELTDTWREAELERQRQDMQAKRDAEKAAILAEQQKAAAWFECDGPYTVDFSGKYFSGSGDIYFQDKFIASFGLMYQSSGDVTFSDMILDRPQNLEHFSRIKEMLRRANRGE